MEVVGRKIYRVTLSDEERQALREIQRGKGAAQRRLRAHILLLADEDRNGSGLRDAAIASVLNVGLRMVERVRQRCVMEGVEAAVERRERANRKPRKLDGEAEAKVLARACSKPPEGHARWTLRMLQSKIVELEIVDSVGRETPRRTLRNSHAECCAAAPQGMKMWGLSRQKCRETMA